MLQSSQIWLTKAWTRGRAWDSGDDGDDDAAMAWVGSTRSMTIGLGSDPVRECASAEVTPSVFVQVSM